MTWHAGFFNLFFVGATLYLLHQNAPEKKHARAFYGAYIVLYTLLASLFWIANRLGWGSQGRIFQQAQPPLPESLVALQSAINLFISYLPFHFFLYVGEKKWPNPDLFSWMIALGKLLGVFVLHGTLFYFVHRAMHHVLRPIHREHHQCILAKPYAAIYAHPIEVFLNNIPSVTALFSIYLLAPPLGIAYIWLSIATFLGIMAHARWGRHDLHHIYRNCNYSAWFIDAIMGTECKIEEKNEEKREARGR